MSMDIGLRSIQNIIVPRPAAPGVGGQASLFADEAVDGFAPFRSLDQLHLAPTGAAAPSHQEPLRENMELFRYQLFGTTRVRDNNGTLGLLPAGGCLWGACAAARHESTMEPCGESREYWSVGVGFDSDTQAVSDDSRLRFIMPRAIPVHRGDDGVITRIIAGEFENIIGPAGATPESRLFLDIQIPPQTPFDLEIPAEYLVLLLPLEGEGLFDLSSGRLLAVSELVRYGEGERVAVSTAGDEVRLLVLASRPRPPELSR